MKECYMEQIVPYPTRNENILDLAFVNNEKLIYSLSVTKTVMSDHNIIEVKTYKTDNMKETKKNKREYRKCFYCPKLLQKSKLGQNQGRVNFSKVAII